ncbi:hypothetical protein [Zooshikella harenae]|uniref:Uncharacterized protein n=1 Tax=Zooshikella harenae TaxID=2827238 RepID=A0ABS5ZGI3_9GAMM|nr:hypothetical protein [Zooshikella harenae]MBU2713179.1 hypothetical protein [Zooshikella harenae]
MDRELAEKTSLLALKIGADMDRNLALIKEACSEEEFKAYQLATGKVMGELLIGFMNPIYKQHPSLKPKEMGGEYEVDPKTYK